MNTDLLTRHELLEQPWSDTCTITLFKNGPDGEKVQAIAIQFDTIINWYAIKETTCPIDGTDWTWNYGDKLPGFTSAETMPGRTDPQNPAGFTLLQSHHRCFVMKCEGDCAETYFLHNFD